MPFLALDQQLFTFINSLPHPYILDEFFLFFSFYPLVTWLILGIVLLFVEEKKDRWFIARLFIALILAGALSSGIIKPLVKRPRPDLSLGNQVIVVSEKPAVLPWNNDYAFPSGHASIAFAGAWVLAHESNRKKNKLRKIVPGWYYVIAILTAISRIYLGKHYPLDVIIGAVLGMGAGWVAWRAVDYVKPPKVS